MAGILDFLTGNDQAASPMGALYPSSPVLDDAANAKRQAAAASLLASMGLSPTNLAPAPSPFGDPSQFSAVPAPPPAPGFGAGATPFGFAGPGSMSGINPAAMAAPAASQPPQQVAAPAPAAQPPATDISSVNRPPAPQDDANDPITVGSYQMPRIGDGFPDDDAPAPKPAPVVAAPGGPAPSVAAPFSLGGSGPGIGDRFGASVQSFANTDKGGLLGKLANGFSALATGQRTDPTGVALQLQGQADNATARALLSKNVDPATIQAAVAAARAGQPDMLKTLISQNFGPDKFQHVMRKNADGSETPGAFDPTTSKYNWEQSAPQGKFSVDPELTGPARLDALRAADPDYARRIESMVNGDIPLPTGVAALKPNADRMIKDVLAVSGSTSASDFSTKAATRKDYGSGLSSRITKSLNTTIQHGADLDKAIDELGNHTWFPGITNYAHDKFAGNTDQAYQKARSDFEVAKEAFSKELDFVLSGGHSSVTGSAEIRANFDRAKSPEELHAAVQSALHKLAARLDSHATGFSQGTKSQRDGQDFLYPKNRATYNKLMGSQDTSTGQEVPGVDASSGAESASAAPAGAVPAPGNYVWTPTGGLVGGK